MFCVGSIVKSSKSMGTGHVSNAWPCEQWIVCCDKSYRLGPFLSAQKICRIGRMRSLRLSKGKWSISPYILHGIFMGNKITAATTEICLWEMCHFSPLQTGGISTFVLDPDILYNNSHWTLLVQGHFWILSYIGRLAKGDLVADFHGQQNNGSYYRIRKYTKVLNESFISRLSESSF